MLDPTESLAFSVHSNPGVYALLLGSGVSRGAGIPTGWDITLDLVRQLAALRDAEAECDPDPEQWYVRTFDKAPEYADLLNSLANTQAERQRLLRSYFEPTDPENENGNTEPTAAHRAIANLASDGFIRIIVTTNFDRLLERAFAEEGMEPTILRSPDEVQGALPLIHIDCLILKLHGDYLDPRIRNTPSELDAYSEVENELLAQIFDEFGLIVCGWSGDWDTALRCALNRSPSRRFTAYWTLRDDPTDHAQRLIDHHRARTIPIADADSFFVALEERVRSLAEFSRPHPFSTEAAIVSLKRYISEPRYMIQFSDLVSAEVEKIMTLTSQEPFNASHRAPVTTESLTAQVRSYDAICSTLTALALVGGFWINDAHFLTWERALARLSPTRGTGDDTWASLPAYPGILLFYSLGVGAVEGNHLDFLARLFTTTLPRLHEKPTRAVELLNARDFFSKRGAPRDVAQMLEGMARRRAPLSDWICDILRENARELTPDENRYQFAFDKFEVLVALSAGYHYRQLPDQFYAPTGSFIHTGNFTRILSEIQESLEAKQDASPFVVAGLFGSTVGDCQQRVTDLDRFVRRLELFLP